jgi:hypothetical protein
MFFFDVSLPTNFLEDSFAFFLFVDTGVSVTLIDVTGVSVELDLARGLVLTFGED